MRYNLFLVFVVIILFVLIQDIGTGIAFVPLFLEIQTRSTAIMPKQPNSHGQDQEYVPKGNGDASGEYADEAGGNRHFEKFESPKKTTAKIEIRKSNITNKGSVYVDNKMVLKDLSDEDLDDIRKTYKEEKNGEEDDGTVDIAKTNAIISAKAKQVIADIENKNRALKYEVGTVVDKDGNILVSANCSEHEVYIDETLLKGAIFTHNHPTGTCLSTQDVAAFVKQDIYQVRATTPDGKAFVITKQKDFVKPNFAQDFYWAGKRGHEGEERVTELFLKYKSMGLSGYEPLGRAVSDYQVEWLTQNANKYYVDFTIEGDD